MTTPVRQRKPEHPLAFHTAQLRHAYTHLINGRVSNQEEFARGLIAPVIRALETYIRDHPVHPGAK
jgi:hypothetical protein